MAKNMPTHVGLILDGNRRWAKAHGKNSVDGHKAGYDSFYKVGRYLLNEKKIPYVSAYVFSTENWNRSRPEVKFLMSLVVRALNEFLEEFHQDGIRIFVVGSRENLDKKVLDAIKLAEDTTKNNKNGSLVLCFNYGGRQEIIDAVKSLARQEVDLSLINEDLINEHIYSPQIPDVDLIIRSSGEHRLSGYLLWRSTYSELYFSDKLWPDFTTDDVDLALADYQNRHRRFGK